jgi:hypothetical protein
MPKISRSALACMVAITATTALLTVAAALRADVDTFTIAPQQCNGQDFCVSAGQDALTAEGYSPTVSGDTLSGLKGGTNSVVVVCKPEGDHSFVVLSAVSTDDSSGNARNAIRARMSKATCSRGGGGSDGGSSDPCSGVTCAPGRFCCPDSPNIGERQCIPRTQTCHPM